MKKRKHFKNYYRDTIWKKFFRPLLIYKDRDMRGWLDFLFNTNYRNIDNYVVRTEFRIPGLFMQAPNELVHKYSPRWIKPGTMLVVRKDMRENHIDVERISVGHERVFRLSFEEWAMVVPYLERLDD